MSNIDEAMCHTMSLEPRLQEYLSKRKFYKKNDIKPPVSLDEQFLITNNDKIILKKFLRNDNDIYGIKTGEKHMDLVDGSNQHFPSSELHNDPRLQKLKDKISVCAFKG